MLPRFTPNGGAGRYFTMAVDFGDLSEQRFQAECWLEHWYDHQLPIVERKPYG